MALVYSGPAPTLNRVSVREFGWRKGANRCTTDIGARGMDGSHGAIAAIPSAHQQCCILQMKISRRFGLVQHFLDRNMAGAVGQTPVDGVAFLGAEDGGAHTRADR